MRTLKGKKVLVLGLGKSGVAAARHLAGEGATVVAADLKSATELGSQMKALAGLPIAFALGRHEPNIFDEAEVIIISPGVPFDLPELLRARSRGVSVMGEMGLAVRLIDRPIVAVTGTNGKTTTTTLIGHLLEGAGLKPCVAGNIGTPLLDVVDDARRSDAVVLEVSSFQIETAPSLSPRIAVWLNATPDHLDRHLTFDAYVACKAKLLARVSVGGWGIYNAADDAVSQAVVTSSAKLMPFDATGRLMGKESQGPCAWFGGGDLCVRAKGEEPNRYPLGDVKLEGIHNRENMLAALSAAELCGADPEDLRRALETFKGLPHRVELVGEHRGVRFYDDSKGTNVGATSRAIEGFAEPVVLIAGGLAKGADFAPLAPSVREHVKMVVLIGRDADLLEKALKGSTEIIRASSMDDAVRQAFSAAQPGDVVLLSPACASFDMFRDYADRGEAFCRTVQHLSSAAKERR
ncbi:MAG: UDP-N-acetylmuramoyl-L-alanine--D-glutamate ligase [Pseudomonadota bacterium]